jgi:hypothetical protein
MSVSGTALPLAIEMIIFALIASDCRGIRWHAGKQYSYKHDRWEREIVTEVAAIVTGTRC